MSSWVNRTPLTGSSVSQNGTNSHTCTFTAASAGNLLVAVLTGSVTFTTPTGWTLVQSVVGTTAVYVFSKVASASESSFTTTHNGSNYPILGIVYEFPSTSTIVGTAGTATGQSATASGPNCTGLSGIYTRFTARAWALGSTGTTASATWVLPTVKDYDTFNASGAGTGIALTTAYDDDCAGPTFIPSSTYTITGSGAGGESVSFAVSSADLTPTPRFVQVRSDTSGATSGTTMVSAFDSTVTQGNLIVVALSYGSTTATASISDTLGNTYSTAVGPHTSATLGFRNYIFYAVSNSTGSNTITATITASVAFKRIILHEYSALDSFDVGTGATGASGLIDSGNVSTTHATEVLVGWGLSNNGTVSAGTGYTLRGTAGSESTEDKFVTSTGSYNATFPADGSAWICQIATFYSSVVGTPPATYVTLPWLRF